MWGGGGEWGGVGRSGVQVEVASVLLDIEPGVEHLVGESRDDDALHADAKVPERGGHQVVGERAPEWVARDLGRDRLGLERADPDRQVAGGLRLFEGPQMRGRRHINPDTVDRDLHEGFHPRSHYY